MSDVALSGERAVDSEVMRRLPPSSDLLAALPVGVAELDAQGRRLRVNEAACAITGRTRDELVGRSVFEREHPDDHDLDQQQYRRLVAGTIDRYQVHKRYFRKDGSVVWLAVHCAAVRDDDNRFRYAVRVFQDVTEARQAAAQLTETAQRLAATYEHAGIGISEVAADGRLLRVNEAACAITGRSREELLSGTIFERAYPEDCELDLAQYRRLIAGEIDRFSLRKRIVRKDGRVIWVDMSCAAVRDHEGKFLYAVRVFQDITETKRAVDALAESEQRLAATYNHAGLAISEVDREGRILRANAAACAITGYERDELLKLTIFDVTHPEDREREREAYRRQAGGEDSYGTEKRLIRKDGQVIWVSVASSTVRGPGGHFLYGIRVLQDITERKLAEMHRQRLAAIVESSQDAIVSKDLNGIITSWNRGAERLFGYGAAEAIGKPVTMLIPSNRRDEETEILRRIREGRRVETYETVRQRKDGTLVDISLAVSPIRDADGTVIGASKIARDITKRKRAETLARESELRFRQLIESLPAAIYTTDAAGRLTYFNQAAVELSGRVPQIGSDQWCVSWRLYRPDGAPLPHDQCPMALALKERRPIRDAEAVAERPDGTRVPFIPYPTPLFDAEGRLTGAVNMLVDISERKQAEARQEVLIQELNHRVKNTLATVQSLARQTARRARTPKAFRERLEGRLMALSEAHNLLSRGNWQRADLREIALAGLAPFTHDLATNITIAGPNVPLPPRMALTLAMVFHELATNAAKYGALSSATGRLVLRWEVEQTGSGPMLRLTWRESGGPEVTPPARRGFGSLLIERGVAADLGGHASLTFGSAGVACEIEAPLPAGPQ
jgi:PAS domain S-box-containing protein